MSSNEPSGNLLLAIAMACAAGMLASIRSCSTDTQLKDEIAVLRADLDEVQATIKDRPVRIAGDLAKRIERLEHRVLYPRFWQHCKTCANCRGDGQSEEGGPPPLCKEGFKLWQDDMREAK